MTLDIKIEKEKCKHLTERSYYNNNFYELPFYVCDHNILYERYDGADNFLGNVIGYIDEWDDFVPCFYLHEENNDTFFDIASENIEIYNKWT
jgi:hypothetical protein